MAKLIYAAITSLDGYVADADGKFDWSAPDEEVHAFVNDLSRSIGTYLFGRRMYEVMVVWEHPEAFADQPVLRDYAEIWRDADKVVYSKTLEEVSSSKTRIERDFDADAIRELKVRAVRDLSVGVRSSPHEPSRPAWWTRSTCSSRPSWSEAASNRSPTVSAWSSSS